MNAAHPSLDLAIAIGNLLLYYYEYLSTMYLGKHADKSLISCVAGLWKSGNFPNCVQDNNSVPPLLV